jgi:transglutaminase-like putative cysteine protease
MLIRLGYDISFEAPSAVPIVALLHVHTSRIGDLCAPDELRLSPDVPVTSYFDSYGNRCSLLLAPQGTIRLQTLTTIRDSGEPDPVVPDARQLPVQELPPAVIQFLLSSRYCEVDLLSNVAYELFGHVEPGWPRVQAVCDWVQSKVKFGYNFARHTKTALDVYTERLGVCRDFQHLAITFCRAMNIPARYVTGYLGDIGVPVAPFPMDFSAWFEAFLDGRWWTFDARHNRPRIGRVVMATGRDAADVAITTSFGEARLLEFKVITEEIVMAANRDQAATAN